VVMSVPELHKYKQHYARQDSNGKYGVWDSDFESMAKKTAIKQVLKYMPKAVEIQRAMINDSAVIELPTPKTSLEDANILQISEEPTEYRLPINAESQVIEEIEIKPNDSIVSKAKAKQVAKESMEMSSKKIETIRAIQAAPITGEEIEELVSMAQNASSQDELDIIIQNMQKQAGIVV
jgi:recombinational DNA repair protein RecT